MRSQDKELLMKINRIDYDYSLGEHKILVNGYQTLVGKYKTKERALKVLDEIQSILNLKDMYKYDRELVLKSWENVDDEQVKIVRQQMSVYEMPEE